MTYFFVAYVIGQVMTFNFTTMDACLQAQAEVYGNGRNTILLQCRYGQVGVR